MSTFQPRPGQREVLAFTGGRMGVSAVPGSGKTRTLAELAARLVARHIADDQEVLVVTLVNSAVDNFKVVINASIREHGLLPNYGYRVRTLHGLAHDIVRERPGLVGLADDFGIVDEREADAIREETVESWLRAHPDAITPYLSPDVEGDKADWVRRSQWPRLARDLAAALIKRAKDSQLTPQVLLERLAAHVGEGSGRFLLARMGAEIYADYQRSLSYRGAVDFDDLIRLALLALQRDEDYLARLQHRWPYILEDEAQDSSELQEKILRLLVGKAGNWVRVGDPNQAIYETFTTANPEYLRTYMNEPGVEPVSMPHSGRSQQAIIDLANCLVDWTVEEHPNRDVRQALAQQHILPTEPGDPQPNPPVDGEAVKLILKEYTPEQELVAVAESGKRWVEEQAVKPEQERQTCAILVPRNHRGFELARILEARDIPYIELLRSTSVTRATAGALGNIMRCLADPTSARRLSEAFQVWRRDDRQDAEAMVLVEAVRKRIRGCQAVEAYLWPRADHDWLASLATSLPGAEDELLTGFRDVACRWHRAAGLPIDQLILTLANELFQSPAELALAHKLAGLLRDVAAAHPTYRLPELVEELAVIARNERRFLGFDEHDSGFQPPKGEITVATMHKAKGLEWDRVYLMSVNTYNFPSGLPADTYIAERWFVRDRLNLEAEALAELELLARVPAPDEAASDRPVVVERVATRQARLDYISERLRLLYVGITRAERDLIITWNTGRRRAQKLQAATPLIEIELDECRKEA